MSATATSHAYGVGLIALLVGVGASTIFYTGFYLPESLAKPSVSEEILNPEEPFNINILLGAVTQGNPNYDPNKSTVELGFNNHVTWTNQDETAHTVTPDNPIEDSYSGEFGSPGVILPGETYEFLFTEPAEIPYHCQPHPWMTGTITVEVSRF